MNTSKTQRKIIAQKKKARYEKKDYSALLQQLQNKAYVAELKKDFEAIREYNKEDEVKVEENKGTNFYVGIDNIYHDRTCNFVKRNLPFMDGKQTLPKRACLCPECARRAMVRQLSGTENKTVQDNFRRFVDDKNIKTSHMKKIYANRENVKFHIVSNDRLRIIAQNDYWEIDFEPELPELWHGNYATSHKNVKYARLGMHKEETNGKTADAVTASIFNRIGEYDFKKNLKHKEERLKTAEMA